MKLQIEGHHYQVSDATRTYVTTAAEKIERFYSPIIECHITLKEVRDTFTSDVVVRVQGHTLKATDTDSKLYKAVDEALDKMTRQLQKLHDKQRNHRRGLQEDGVL